MQHPTSPFATRATGQPGQQPFSTNPYPPQYNGSQPGVGGYPPTQTSPYGSNKPGYPPQTGYPQTTATGGYPPTTATGGYPPPTTATGGYHPPTTATGGYPPPTTATGGFPHTSTGGYPPQTAYPPNTTTGGFPHTSTGGYPPQTQTGGFPPQVGGGFPPQTYPPVQRQNWVSTFLAQVTPKEMQDCRQWFDSVDTDKSGSISAIELAQVQFNNRPLQLPVAQKLIKVFDKDHSGAIDFNEYVALHKFLLTMQNAFFTADADRSGTIDAREIHGALQKAGFQLSFQTVQAITTKFDKDRRGIDFPIFLFLTAHLGHIRSIFEWNDTRNLGQITLSFDAFCHIGCDLLP